MTTTILRVRRRPMTMTTGTTDDDSTTVTGPVTVTSSKTAGDVPSATRMRLSLVLVSISVLLLLLLLSENSMIKHADAFVVGGRGRGLERRGRSNYNNNNNAKLTLEFVHYPPTTKIIKRSSRQRIVDATTTKLFSGDDDDDDDDDNDDMGGDDYDDDDYDDTELVIDVEGDDDYDEDVDDYEDDDNEDLEDDPYVGLAASEFDDNNNDDQSSSAMTMSSNSNSNSDSSSSSSSSSSQLATTDVDWGGALGSLRTRMEDVESGKYKNDPSQALFRMMSAPSPNQIIGQFVSSANPQVVQAMSGAVTSLLGGLSNPNMGVEIQVKASGEQIGSLCFQLQMTGYMFRNAEYVLALKDLMKLKGKQLHTIEDYKAAFDRLDTDNSGFIEIFEIQELFKEAYGGRDADVDDIPAYEITAFLEFFDSNEDGKVSWEEFKKGLASSSSLSSSSSSSSTRKAKDEFADRLLASMEAHGVDDDEEEEDHDDHDDHDQITETISGTIEIEMDDGKVVVVDAKEYMENLKEEAQKLKLALRREKMGGAADPQNNKNNSDPMGSFLQNNNNSNNADNVVDIAGYIASRQGDVKSLTEGITPEIVDTMKKLVNFVLEGGENSGSRTTNNNNNKSNNNKNNNLSDQEKAEMEMEIPGSALQQLALWQLVLGYRLREEEAKGDYVKLLK